jgi:O-antigen ligase
MHDIHIIESDNNSKLNIFFIILFFLIIVPSSFHPIINSISLYVLIPSLFLYSVIIDFRLILYYKPIIFLLLIYCWSFLTIISSKDLNISLREIKQITGVLLLCCIFIRFCLINPKYIIIIYLFYILKFFTAFYYAYQNNLFLTGERLNSEEINANTFGYYGFNSIVSSFFLWQNFQNQIKVKFIIRFSLFVLFLSSVFCSVVACFYAASRAGIILTLLMASFLVLLRYLYPFSVKKIYTLILILILSIILFLTLKSYFETSLLKERFQIETMKDESRYLLFVKGIEVGCQNPIFGVGPGNFILYNNDLQFSHSTFTELFANNGIVSLFLFIALLKYFYNKNKLIYARGNIYRRIALYFFAFLILFIVYNLFYTFHLELFLMGFFYIVLATMENILVNEINSN